MRFLERLVARLFHRHAYWTTRVVPGPGMIILNQVCRHAGCDARRVVYDDGTRVSWRRRRALERSIGEWVDVNRLDRAAPEVSRRIPSREN